MIRADLAHALGDWRVGQSGAQAALAPRASMIEQRGTNREMGRAAVGFRLATARIRGGITPAGTGIA